MLIGSKSWHDGHPYQAISDQSANVSGCAGDGLRSVSRTGTDWAMRDSIPRHLPCKGSALASQPIAAPALTNPESDGCTTGCTNNQETDQTDPDLAAIVASWQTLPEPLKAGVLAMIRAAGV